MDSPENLTKFLDQVDERSDTGCWVWTGTISKGHGIFRPTGFPQVSATRYSYQHYKGAIPENQTIAHTCGDLSCVNPEHLVVNTIEYRLFSRMRKDGDCWISTANHDHGDGYRYLVIGKRHVRVHRLSYELRNGPIPEGMMVCHRCDTPSCINPDHLFLGTTQDNTADMVAKGRQRTFTKLTEDQVGIILHSGLFSGMTNEMVGIQFGVSKSTIGEIRRGASWKRVPRDHEAWSRSKEDK